MTNVAQSLKSPLNFYQSLQVKSVGEIFQSDSLSIGAISRLLNDENNLATRALLNIIIDDTVKFFNVGKTMTGAQMIQTVELIVEDYKHFKPEDFKKCFNNAKKGHYGVTYDRIDGQIIFEWLLKYDAERDAEIEAIRAKQNRVYKMESSLPIIPKLDDLKLDAEKDLLFKTNMEKLKANLKGFKTARVESTADSVKNPIYEMHQRWIAQFDKLWVKQKNKAGRVVYKYGKVKSLFKENYGQMVKRMLDINAYLEHKQWQFNLSQLPKEKRQKEYLKAYPKNA